MEGVFDKEKVDAAISHISDYFRDNGYTLFEAHHVCRCLAAAAISQMGEKAAAVVQEKYR